MSRPVLEWRDLGTVPYAEAWALQDALREKRIAGDIPNTLLLLEHPPVFTMGKRDCAGDFVSSPESVAEEGIEVVKTNRGGGITYHGPGQLVGYFICRISDFVLGVRDFVGAVERMCMLVLSRQGVEGARDEGHPGIWVGRSKIVAIGMNVQHGITQHGFALNVDLDLKPYRHIVACGIRDRGVTSIAALTGRSCPMRRLKSSVAEAAGEVLGCVVREEKGPYAEVNLGSSASGVGSSAGGSS
ncbi:MAG TPA: lipoyl(octanoyl) transferase LipB [bacterium]|nr:lipoyl(octanoyl) transferase LipB [bacterium]